MVRIAVVGCGWWSTYAHIPAILANKDAQLVALVDADQRRLQTVQDQFGVSDGYTSTAEMLHSVECDAVVIAVPNAFHYKLADLVIRSGRHLLLEKPMVLHPADGRDLLARADQNGVHVVVGYELNYNRQAETIRAELSLGRIGVIESVSCLFASIVRELFKGEPAAYRERFDYPVHGPSGDTYHDASLSGGGQGQVQITHAASLLFRMTGLQPKSVAAFTHNADLDVDLADAVAIRFQGGAVGTLSSTGGVSPNQDEVLRYAIFGRAGHVIFDLLGGSASIHDSNGVEVLPRLNEADREPERAPVDNLVELVLGRGTNSSPPDAGLLTVEFLAAMYRSAETQTFVRLSEE